MAPLRLAEEAARDVLLVRAIESEDSAGAVFTHQDRQHASTVALNACPLVKTAPARDTGTFLEKRAASALERLVGRYPMLQRTRSVARWPSWLNWVLPITALVTGLGTNAIDGSQLNILAFPLLGMIAWNVAVYAWLLFSWMRRTVAKDRPHVPSARWLERVLSPPTRHLAGHPTLERAVTRFGSDWMAAASSLNRTRLIRTLHLSAAAFAAGLLGGMFARARYMAEYTASWAGTWAGAEAEIAALLKVVLGPASALTGIGLPTVERLRELRGAGENAGDWLILWLVTAALYVIVPRLLLTVAAFFRTERLKRRLPVAHDLYVRRVVRDAVGDARQVRIVPYGFELSAMAVGNLKRLLGDVLGQKTTIQVDAPVAYGNEDQWLEANVDQPTGSDQLILLFNLSSTPEAENHGEMVSGVQRRLGSAVELFVLLDDSGFVHRHRRQASAPRRLEERLHAWRAVLAAGNVDPVRVTLDQEPNDAAARSLEQALLRGNATQ